MKKKKSFDNMYKQRYLSKEQVDAYIYGIFPKDKKRTRIEWIILGVCIIGIILLMVVAR